MTSILVVDDNPMDRRVACSILESEGWQTFTAENAETALEQIPSQQPDIVLSDLQMPEVDGLELVRQVVSDHPDIPVVIMTGHGSEELAVKALQQGALSYVPKEILSKILVSTLKDVLKVSQGRKKRGAVLRSIKRLDTLFELNINDTSVEALVTYLVEGLEVVNFSDEGDRIRVGTALHEALMNAREHGNLELDSKMRDDDDDGYRELAEARLRKSPYKDRKIFVRATLDRDHVAFTIRDEGPGFDTTNLPDPTSPENIGRVSGRGLFLIRTFMDKVVFSDSGNEIVMSKRRPADQE
jgi:CheY-like chemotaxis protein/anti-sigma regulatory factor (Ser/Thr protein kinase)